MKKVRFVTPTKVFNPCNMNEIDCHSPRPILETQLNAIEPNHYSQTSKTITFSSDPLHRYQYSNASPNPIARRTNLVLEESKCYPTNELELTMLDTSSHEPRKALFEPVFKNVRIPQCESCGDKVSTPVISSSLTAVNGEILMPRNIKENSFFIRRDNIASLEPQPINSLRQQLKMMQVDKENNPNIIKSNCMPEGIYEEHLIKDLDTNCNCHHCSKEKQLPCLSNFKTFQQNYNRNIPKISSSCSDDKSYHRCSNEQMQPKYCMHGICNCNDSSNSETVNAVEKKTWAVQKYENSKKLSNMEIEKQTNVTKDKREPTVADLFKIIKLQNEQLQLLQEKVDKFISVNNNVATPQPVQNHVTEYVAAETVNSKESKISIGVMTSFEVVHTSTIINREIVKTNKNAQIQCNRSQISIKEVVSKTQPVNVNFLEGLRPIDIGCNGMNRNNCIKSNEKDIVSSRHHGEQVNEEKTLNEQSLFNVRVDNATTPLMSPDQTLYLDVRDYSDSDSGSEHSNIGWTYYNKVMTHVNGMLQDSDMPSSASTLWRNTRQQCMQMQIDKTNVSVMKRVKFGEDVFITRTPQNNVVASTDTSFKMKQLAAKYLKSGSCTAVPEPAVRPTATNDMSMATRNYMERHQIIQGSDSKPAYSEMPRFLDITALKQQPKFL